MRGVRFGIMAEALKRAGLVPRPVKGHRLTWTAGGWLIEEIR